MEQDIHRVLKEYWGYDHFRPQQEEIIRSVLEGNDTLALLPTGGGKSVCFQVPALVKEGVCLVVSPLIALMKDQLENLKRKGVPALAVYSGMGFQEVKKTLQNAAYGNYKFLYVSPERLESRLFLEYLPAIPVSLIAVDEAHCIAQWGHDFRPPYLRIAGIRDQLPGVSVIALTASATCPIQEDIRVNLKFGSGHRTFMQPFERPNLSYSVFSVASKQNKLLEILNKVPGTAIVYCKSRKHTREIAELLKMNRIGADHYHAGLNSGERTRKQEDWIQNRTRVIVCTNAFGMGIDKPDVRVVVHYDVPDCLENYYQEAGRAGRDGKRAYAILLYTAREPEELRQQVDLRYPDEVEIKKTYIALMNHLQIPAGTGEGLYFDLDMAAFTSAFKLNILKSSYAIKALEQEDILSYNEVFFKPSTLVFTTSKEELADLEKQFPVLEPLIKGLLRSYEGIFDHPAVVYESQLAKFIRQDPEAVKEGLKKLNDLGIIAYDPQKEKPQLFLLQNRMYADNYAFNPTNHRERKKKFEERLKAILSYMEQEKGCRSQAIALYFGAAINKPCGICDLCINQKSEHLSLEEFENISEQVLRLTKNQPVSLPEMIAKLSGIRKENIRKVVDFLQSERKIAETREGAFVKL